MSRTARLYSPEATSKQSHARFPIDHRKKHSTFFLTFSAMPVRLITVKTHVNAAIM